MDENGNFIKLPDLGPSDQTWEKMVAFAKEKGWKGGDYKRLNRPFENKLLGLQAVERDRMVRGVEDFVYHLITEVFNGADTASLAVEAILKAGSYDLGPKATRIEDSADWTEEKIRKRAESLTAQKGPEGDFED